MRNTARSNASRRQLRPAELVTVLFLFGCLVLGGCTGGGDDDAADGTGGASDPTADTEDATGATSDPPEPPPPAPAERACYSLTDAETLEAHSEVEPVACRRPHTTETFLVGKLPRSVIGDADGVDSRRISETVDRRCSKALGGHLGGNAETRTLARLSHVWFVPSEEGFALGARWFRCDVVAHSGPDELAELPRRTTGLLEAEDALDTWGTCDRTGGDLNPERLWRTCARPHNWRAVSVLDLGDTSDRWPGRSALAGRADECEPAVRSYLGDSTGELSLRLSYPTRAQWSEGRRFGFCWTESD